MGSRRTESILAVFAAAGAVACCAYVFSCSNGGSTPAASTDAGADGPAVPGNLSCGADSPDWPMFGQNVCNTNSQATAGGISPSTVGTLGVKWVYAAHGDISATPSVVSGNVYVADWGGYIEKLDAASGAVVWEKKLGDLLASVGDAGPLPGFSSRNAPVVTNGSVIFGTLRGTELATSPGASAYLVAIDQSTGALQWATLLDSHPAAIIAGSPVVDGNTLYVGVSSNEEYSILASALNPSLKYTCCSFRGSVVAVDVKTGAIKWQTPMISDSLYYSAGDAGKLTGFAGNAVWSSTPAVDRKRNQIYVTTGNNYEYSKPSEAEAGAAEGNYVDAVLALDMTTGTIKWSHSLPRGGEDLWTVTKTSGADSDFGAGANFFSATINGKLHDIVGAGQKSGVYWAFDADTGNILWNTTVGPWGHLGGIHWGTATDGTRIYAEINYESGAGHDPLTLGGTGPNAGKAIQTGTWAALDPTNGDVLWQIENPTLPSGPNSGAACNGPVAAVGGVLFAGSMDSAGTMFALNAATGAVLWQFASGGTVYGGPAIANGVVYWGSGYPNGQGARPLGFGTSSKKLYAFALGLGHADGGAEAGIADGATDAGLDGGTQAGLEAGRGAARE